MQNKANCPYFGVDFSSLDTLSDENLLFSQIDFMWCRAYGRDHTGSGDSQTINNVTAARRNNCPVGCYYFGFPFVDAAAGISTDAEIIANAEEQAQQFIDKLYLVFGQGNVGDLIPMLDVEQYIDSTSQYGHTATGNERYPQAVMTSEQLVTWVLAFKNYFNSTTGWRLGMYTGDYWIQAPRPTEGIGLTSAQIASLNPPEDPLPLWVARYDEYNALNDSVPNFGNYTEFDAWQYTGSGNASAMGITEPKYNYLDYNRTDSLTRIQATRITGDTGGTVGAGKINFGEAAISKIYLGSAEVTHVYLGATEIYSPAPILPTTTISPAETIQNNIPITVTLTCDDPAATIYYKIGTQAEKIYTDPFTVNQDSAGVYNTLIPVTYWAVSESGTEVQKTITYNTAGAKPSQPVLTATAEEGQVTLSWTGATNTTSYTVFRSTTPGDTGTILAGTQYMTARTWTDTTVTGGTTYYYIVQAGNYSLATNSAQKSATPTAPIVQGYRYARQWMHGGYIVPSATVTNLNSMIEFQVISASAGNVLLGKPNLEGYPAKLAGTSNPASNITDGVTADMWSYAVWSDSTDGLAHAITYDMGALYTDITEAKTWHNYASAGRFYNFKIEVCATNSPNPEDWTTIIDALDNSTTRIYEETSAGFTFPMPISYGTPEKPLLELTNLTNSVRLDWQPTAETTSFKVYRTSNPDNLGPMLQEVTPETTTYTDTTAVGGNTYYYTVKAVNPSNAKNSDKRTGVPYDVLVYESKNVDFEGKTAWTVYDATQVTADFGNATTVQGGDRLKIDTSGRLRFDLPAGVVGSANAGGIVKAKIAGKNEYTFEYEIRFDTGFPWSKGGKVPGFSGGKGYTGGEGSLARTLGDGFSVRMMWREDGRIIPYVYHAGMAEGEDYGDTFGLTLGYFTNTTAHTVKYYAKLNTGSDANGILRIYLDGAEVMNKTNLLYRTDESKIDTAHLAVFPGGSTVDWNMTAQGYIRLSNFSWT